MAVAAVRDQLGIDVCSEVIYPPGPQSMARNGQEYRTGMVPIDTDWYCGLCSCNRCEAFASIIDKWDVLKEENQLAYSHQ